MFWNLSRNHSADYLCIVQDRHENFSSHSYVLIIDDDPDDCALLQENLAEHGITRMSVADHGVAALALLASSDLPDLVILDMNMPVMDGTETLTRIKSDLRLRHLLVIVFTTSCSPDQTITLEKLGALACMIKPNSFVAYSDTVTVMLQLVTKAVAP